VIGDQLGTLGQFSERALAGGESRGNGHVSSCQISRSSLSERDGVAKQS
jgi:hypothetical protein